MPDPTSPTPPAFERTNTQRRSLKVERARQAEAIMRQHASRLGLDFERLFTKPLGTIAHRQTADRDGRYAVFTIAREAGFTYGEIAEAVHTHHTTVMQSIKRGLADAALSNKGRRSARAGDSRDA